MRSGVGHRDGGLAGLRAGDDVDVPAWDVVPDSVLQEIADQERLSWTLSKFPPQPYMKELYWQYSKDTPAFFRDSLVQSWDVGGLKYICLPLLF